MSQTQIFLLTVMQYTIQVLVMYCVLHNRQQKYIDSVKVLDDYLKQGAISYEQYFGGILDATGAFHSKKKELEKAQADAEIKAILDQQQRLIS